MLAAIGKDDTQKEVESMANKILKAKLWDNDEGGRWKWGVKDIEGEILCGMPSSLSQQYHILIRISVSQFTLLASVKKGNKPDFHKSASGEKAKELYDQFFKKVQALYQADRVKDGVFQAMMDVALVNDGPVGVDYTCEDGAVNISMSANVLEADMFFVAGHYPDRHGSSQDGQPYKLRPSWRSSHTQGKAADNVRTSSFTLRVIGLTDLLCIL